MLIQRQDMTLFNIKTLNLPDCVILAGSEL
jgi:hypothetical protein